MGANSYGTTEAHVLMLSRENDRLTDEATVLREKIKRLHDTIEAMLAAAGWDGTLEQLDSVGTKPSHFIRSAVERRCPHCGKQPIEPGTTR